ncbi:hypothetical protein [Alkalihalobacillus sp. LMS39]|uniref:hypothetical protein n=1 Tax=Alkalihalobacillus sp. LMS39 TaxID=2924032 RepID=UPI001FB468B9|nr:hypothetical protein [Alkalihalobacillus sp. LMS39]UOE95752.1 hypothetical protein MM271_09180 [Alkalihalobacillus sp. LMS39]
MSEKTSVFIQNKKVTIVLLLSLLLVIGIIITLFLSLNSGASIEDFQQAIKNRDAEGVLAIIDSEEGATQEWTENTVAYLFETLNKNPRYEDGLFYYLDAQRLDFEGELVSRELVQESREEIPFLIVEGKRNKPKIIARAQRVVLTTNVDNVEISIDSDSHTINKEEQVDLGTFAPGEYKIEGKTIVNGQEITTTEKVDVPFFGKMNTNNVQVNFNIQSLKLFTPIENTEVYINEEKVDIEWNQVQNPYLGFEYQGTYNPVVEGDKIYGVVQTPVGEFTSEINEIDSDELVFNVLQNEQIKNELFSLLETYEKQRIEVLENESVDYMKAAVSDEIMNDLRKDVNNLSPIFGDERHYEGTLKQIRMVNYTNSMKLNQQENLEVEIEFETIVHEGRWKTINGRDINKDIKDNILSKNVTFEYKNETWTIKNFERNYSSSKLDSNNYGEAKKEQY